MIDLFIEQIHDMAMHDLNREAGFRSQHFKGTTDQFSVGML